MHFTYSERHARTVHSRGRDTLSEHLLPDAVLCVIVCFLVARARFLTVGCASASTGHRLTTFWARCAAPRAGFALSKPRLLPLGSGLACFSRDAAHGARLVACVSFWVAISCAIEDCSNFFDNHFVLGLVQCVRTVQAAPARVNVSRFHQAHLQCLV